VQLDIEYLGEYTKVAIYRYTCMYLYVCKLLRGFWWYITTQYLFDSQICKLLVGGLMAEMARCDGNEGDANYGCDFTNNGVCNIWGGEPECNNVALSDVKHIF